MRVGKVVLKSRGKPYINQNVPVDTTALHAAYTSCYNYTKQLAKDFGIDIGKSDWRTLLKDKLNEGYGNNNRNNRKGYEALLDADKMYQALINNGNDFIQYLTTHYNTFRGAEALGKKMADSYQQLVQATSKDDIRAKKLYVQGDLEEYLASALRSVQYKSGSVSNTQKAKYNISIIYDIERHIPELDRSVYWEVKKGVKPNFIDSHFHFGDFSMVQSFYNNEPGMILNLRKEILNIIYLGQLDSLLGKNSVEQIQINSFVQMTCAYIAERLKQGQVLFTNSKGDINYGFEIIAGFLNLGMMDIQKTNYHGKMTDEDLKKSDEKYFADMRDVALQHKEEIADKVLNKLSTAGNRIKISVWYGK